MGVCSRLLLGMNSEVRDCGIDDCSIHKPQNTIILEQHLLREYLVSLCKLFVSVLDYCKYCTVFLVLNVVIGALVSENPQMHKCVVSLTPDTESDSSLVKDK
jgi:hypothetical protein